MTTPTLIDAAVDVLGNRYNLTEDDALDMLSVSSRVNDLSVADLASWLIYDAEGHYYPEPTIGGSARATARS